LFLERRFSSLVICDTFAEANTHSLIGVILLSAVASTAALAASQEQCSAEWKKADRDLDGDLSGNEITTYLIAMMKDARHREAGKAFDEIINKAK
jgi:hypothetical protein